MIGAIGRLVGSFAKGVTRSGGNLLESAPLAAGAEKIASIPKPIAETPKPGSDIIDFTNNVENIGKVNPRKGLEALAKKKKPKYDDSIKKVVDDINANANLPKNGAQAPSIENPSDRIPGETIAEITDRINRENNLPYDGTRALPEENPSQNKIVENEEEKKTHYPNSNPLHDPPNEPAGQPHKIISKTMEELPEVFPGGNPEDVAREAP